MRYDVIIIGAGPAGMSAALDAAYLKLKALVLDADVAGGALSQTYPWKRVDSFLGFRDMKGMDVARRLVEHVRKEGIEIREHEKAEEVSRGKRFTVRTARGKYDSSAIIIATGIRGLPRQLSAPGERLAGVEYSVSDPAQYDGKRVLVIGGGDSAADTALGLYEAGAQVWLAHRKHELRARDECRERLESSGVEILWDTEVASIRGKGKVEKVVLANNQTGERRELECDSVIISIGSFPAEELIKALGIRMKDSLVKVDADGMTALKGVFAAGDIVSPIKRIPQALASGERAAYGAYKFIKSPYWK